MVNNEKKRPSSIFAFVLYECQKLTFIIYIMNKNGYNMDIILRE